MKKEKAIVFGTGKYCTRIYEKGFLDCFEVIGFVDNDVAKHGRDDITGGMILSPSFILENDKWDRIIVAIGLYEEVVKQLTQEYGISVKKIVNREQIEDILFFTSYNKSEEYVELLDDNTILNTPIGYKIITKLDGIEDDNLVERIINAYNAEESNDSKDVWGDEGYLGSLKNNIRTLLVSGNKNKVGYALRNPISNNLLWGFEDIAVSREVLDRDYVDNYVESVKNKIITLCSLLGVIRIPNPQGGTAIKYNNENIDDIFDRVSEFLGIDLIFPNPYPEEIGIKTKRGLINQRSIQALYQAIRIKQIIEIKSEGAKVMEIGAGLGRTAFFSDLLGIKDYTIIDIPMTEVAQSYFLGRTLGDNAISIDGDNKDAEVKIVPYNKIWDIEEEFDLIINVDSLTEMDIDTQKDYWQYIKTHTKKFLSINHEANEHTVRELYFKDDYKSVTRNIYPMRAGYLEEVVTFE